MFKHYIQKKLELYVVRYFEEHPKIKLAAITGSVGKTSTKLAVATVLSEQFRVRVNEGNHNTQMSAPLAILGIEYPKNIKNIFAWLKVFALAKKRIKSSADVDVIVQELGTDRVGEIAHFGTYLKPDIGIITAVSPEHMEFFRDIETVAKEELELANYSKQALINRDDIDGKFAKYIKNKNIDTYGTTAAAEYNFTAGDYTLSEGYKGKLVAPEWVKPKKVKIFTVGEHTLRPAIAACAVAIKLGMDEKRIASGLSKVRPAMGRMNVLRGVKDTIIIDDSYNSSPLAAISALRTLYQINSPQRIAVLGDMNELGEVSEEEHRKLGKMCNPEELAWVVIVGEQAKRFIATEAEKRGCQVKICKNSIEAGSFVNSIIEPGAAILFKGSQGGIFLEEAVKVVLHSAEDESRLVRQSESWMKIKNNFFSKF